MNEIFINMLATLLYSGPLFTYGSVILLYSTASRVRFFCGVFFVHMIAFLPFVYLKQTGADDSEHALLFPAVSGAFTFLTGLIYLIYLFVQSKKKVLLRKS